MERKKQDKAEVIIQNLEISFLKNIIKKDIEVKVESK